MSNAAADACAACIAAEKFNFTSKRKIEWLLTQLEEYEAERKRGGKNWVDSAKREEVIQKVSEELKALDGMITKSLYYNSRASKILEPIQNEFPKLSELSAALLEGEEDFLDSKTVSNGCDRNKVRLLDQSSKRNSMQSVAKRQSYTAQPEGQKTGAVIESPKNVTNTRKVDGIYIKKELEEQPEVEVVSKPDIFPHQTSKLRPTLPYQGQTVKTRQPFIPEPLASLPMTEKPSQSSGSILPPPASSTGSEALCVGQPVTLQPVTHGAKSREAIKQLAHKTKTSLTSNGTDTQGEGWWKVMDLRTEPTRPNLRIKDPDRYHERHPSQASSLPPVRKSSYRDPEPTSTADTFPLRHSKIRRVENGGQVRIVTKDRSEIPDHVPNGGNDRNPRTVYVRRGNRRLSDRRTGRQSTDSHERNHYNRRRHDSRSPPQSPPSIDFANRQVSCNSSGLVEFLLFDQFGNLEELKRSYEKKTGIEIVDVFWSKYQGACTSVLVRQENQSDFEKKATKFFNFELPRKEIPKDELETRIPWLKRRAVDCNPKVFQWCQEQLCICTPSNC